jgi:TonB family protein
MALKYQSRAATLRILMTGETRRITWSSWLTVAIVTVALWPVLNVTAAAPLAGSLRSFYVAKGPSFGRSSREIVSVESVGRDARIRVIRVAAVNEYCPDIQLVTAAERLVRDATVQAVAGIDICAMSQRTIDRAMARSKTPRVEYVDYMGGGQTLVADCGGHQRVLGLFDTSPWVNFETLHRRAPTVWALWDLDERLSERMLPPRWEAPDAAHEVLGTALLPDLRSTKYAEAFGDELVNALKGYTGPPTERELLPAEVLERDTLPLVAFITPKYPPIALSARISGDVRLRLRVNTETGAVTQVDRISDKPILGDAAVQAVRTWKFDPARVSPEPIEVTMRFQIRCRKY